MNKLSLVVVILFTLFELIIGDLVIYGIPVWLVGLIIFSLVWMVIIGVKDKVKIRDSY